MNSKAKRSAVIRGALFFFVSRSGWDFFGYFEIARKVRPLSRSPWEVNNNGHSEDAPRVEK